VGHDPVLWPLRGLLQQLLAGQKDANEQLQRQQAEIDALKAAAAAAAEQQQEAGGSQDAAADALRDLQVSAACLSASVATKAHAVCPSDQQVLCCCHRTSFQG
jgi:hypothetical protein